MGYIKFFKYNFNIFLLYKLVYKSYHFFKDKQLIYKYLNIDIPNKFKFSDFSIKLSLATYTKRQEKYFIDKYCSHIFNWLGSGWQIRNIKEINFDKKGKWLEKVLHKNHLVDSISIWKTIVDININYKPINWQLDIKSNFIFDAKKSFDKQRDLIKIEGVDLKTPWELARMQHLPQMAILANQNDFKNQEITNEFRCQVLDFIMSNPVGMGVNWNCTMEVGIRISNIIIAYDWFKQSNSVLKDDIKFLRILESSISEHLFFITNHFEYKKDLRANHYLGNLTGLSFITCYAEENKEINKWLAYCIQEIENETDRQFFEDGGNFEGSTSYHRLSAELIMYPSAILENVGKKRIENLKKVKPFFSLFYPSLKIKTINKFRTNLIFNNKHSNKLFKILQFTKTISKENKEIVQIGDNDNGRLFKLSFIGEFIGKKEIENKYFNISINDEHYWDENELNHSSLINGIEAFFYNKNESNFEYDFIKQLVKIKPKPQKEEQLKYFSLHIPNLEFVKEKEIKLNIDLYDKELKLSHFEKFGIIILKAKNFYLSIYYGANGKSQKSWGHQHNDKLSFDLTINNIDIYFDPGTYCYTSNHKLRNKFRSNFYHNNVVIKNEEQNPLPSNELGLFNFEKRTKTQLHFMNKQKIILSNRYDKIIHYRTFDLYSNKLVITDFCNYNFEQKFNSSLLSNGYGKLIKI